MKKSDFRVLAKKILCHKKVGVFSHVRPDGDCIGSQIALCLWLQKNGVEATAFNEDTIPINLAWLCNSIPITSTKGEDMDSFDAFVFVDGNALFRFGDTAGSLNETGKPLYMIDHHPDPEAVFDAFISQEGYSSTCELIFNLYEAHDITQIDTPAAKAMFTGIVTDTASFQFDSVTPDTLRAGSELLKHGDFSPSEVSQKIYSNRPARQLRLLSKALDTIELHSDGNFASISITQKMMDETGTTKEDTEGFVAYPLSIQGVKACILAREGKERTKLSLRSKSDVDVNQWARQMNGGGHKKAAGAWHKGTVEEAISEAVKIGNKQL
ncbi:MAG: bifunctional oligoribonuclease/PAP phosphatase NrnA [Balneolaceae bacterium]|nr:bifunctional oligoribonuclease/PAP phosphatase NrnA [Balneolaceae bacterium]